VLHHLDNQCYKPLFQQKIYISAHKFFKNLNPFKSSKNNPNETSLPAGFAFILFQCLICTGKKATGTDIRQILYFEEST
jgi:hypothetical protein